MYWRLRPLFMGLVSLAIGARCEAQPANPSEASPQTAETCDGGCGCASLDTASFCLAPLGGGMPFDAVARLRPASAFEAGLIEEGLCRSATLRSLVAAVERSDLIVYVNVKRLSSGNLAGGLQFLGASATRRFLRVVIGLTVDRTARIALLGHELQHAVEVARAPEIRSETSFDSYFRLHGAPGAVQHAHETGAARHTEARVRTEAARSLNTCARGSAAPNRSPP